MARQLVGTDVFGLQLDTGDRKGTLGTLLGSHLVPKVILSCCTPGSTVPLNFVKARCDGIAFGDKARSI
jgi:hypothetical protein